jgi:hypothetical protein
MTKIEMKQLVCGAILCAVGIYAMAASSPGRLIGPSTEPMTVTPLACAAQDAGTVRADTDTPQLLAANANCASDCESRFNLCLKEAKTDAIRDKCKVYFKGCLKSCSQGK